MSTAHQTVFLFFCLILLVPLPATAQWHSSSESVMGTRASVELWHTNKRIADKGLAAVMAAMHHVDQLMSPYIQSSELCRINALAAKSPVKISQELIRVIDKALYYSRRSKGAFDISFSSVGKYYDYRQGLAPNEKQLTQSLPAINYQLIELNKKNKTIYFKHPQLAIDLGGIAKGYAVDLAIEKLTDLGIESAIVTAGGDSRILGDRQGTPWVVGIRHPRKDNQNAVRIPLENSAISTSGDYERFFIKDEQRVHHIINPSTGKSASDVQSVSILAPLAIDSDALSTTVFVLGVKKGLALVNEMQGIDAVIIDAGGKMHYSAALLMPVKKQ